jgi:RND family efflux transporter MFP subunit
MSRALEGDPPPPIAKPKLRDELASLRIERDRPLYDEPSRAVRRRSSAGTRLSRVLGWLFALGVVGGVGYVGYTKRELFQPAKVVEVTTVQAMTPGEAEKLLSAKGYLIARKQAAVGVKLPGRVADLSVTEGSKVRQGELIAVLEHNEIDALIKIRQAMLIRTNAELEEAKADLRDKQRAFDRVSRLLPRNSASPEEFDKAQAARDMSEARVQAVEASLEVMQAQIAESQENVRNMEIRAPFDGTIIRLEAEVGETISTMSLGTGGGRSAVITLADLNQLDVETDVAENLLSRIVLGQPAQIVVAAAPGKVYRGRLNKIIPQGDRARGTVKVEVEILDPDARLFPELAATVHFLPDSSLNNPDANKTFFFVNKSAIREENGHSHVWVVDKDQKVAKRVVEVVSTSSDSLARVDSGLKAGETVILHPDPTQVEGEFVKLAK